MIDANQRPKHSTSTSLTQKPDFHGERISGQLHPQIRPKKRLCSTSWRTGVGSKRRRWCMFQMSLMCCLMGSIRSRGSALSSVSLKLRKSLNSLLLRFKQLKPMSTNFHALLSERIDRYFAEVTDGQLAVDLEKAGFGFYNQIGRQVPIERSLGTLTITAPVVGPGSWRPPAIPARPVRLAQELDAA